MKVVVVVAVAGENVAAHVNNQQREKQAFKRRKKGRELDREPLPLLFCTRLIKNRVQGSNWLVIFMTALPFCLLF